MKRLFISTVLALLSLCTSGQQFFSGVTEYLQSISVMPADSIIARCDKLIEAAETEDKQSAMAGLIFDFFSVSPIMGNESVAIYVADNYFLNHRLKWSDPNTLPALSAYAEFNRESLIGMHAPDLILENEKGDIVDISTIHSKYKVLYFYEKGCSTCSRTTPKLIDLLNNYNDSGDITLIAVYTQDIREDWNDYIEHNLLIDNPRITLVNLWDPEATSSFHRKYSLLTTPGLFLLDEGNFIRGRKLDVEALAKLLNSGETYSNSLTAFLADMFEGCDDIEATSDITDYFYEKTAADNALFRDTFMEIFRFFRSQPGSIFSLSAERTAKKYFLEKEDLWSPETIEEVRNKLDKMHLNSIGTQATDAVLLNPKAREKKLLGKKCCSRKYTLLYFNLVSCRDCVKMQQELEQMSDFLKEKRVKVVSVCLSPDNEEWLNHIATGNPKWQYLFNRPMNRTIFESYDLEYVPKLYLLDNKGKVLAKEISTKDLLSILSND